LTGRFRKRLNISGRLSGVIVLERSATDVVGIAAQIAKLQRSNVVVGDLEIGCERLELDVCKKGGGGTDENTNRPEE
jgi:hypothetical protein